ncbi:MAG: hypothetical protein ABH808_02295 [Candidatus Kuenenbacteria bacterium]
MPQEQENQNNNEEDYEATMREARNNVSLSSKLIALKKYQAMAFKLRKQIGDFSIVFFTLAFLFAGFKDLLDICSIELFSWLDWIIDLLFGAVLFFGLGKGSFQQVKRIRMTTVITSVAEAIPIIGALPSWTASLLWLYIKTGQENGTATMKLEEIQKKITALQNEIAQMS